MSLLVHRGFVLASLAVTLLAFTSSRGQQDHIVKSLEDVLRRHDEALFTAARLPEPPPGTVVLVNVIIVDNGDGDQWADTNETVEMHLTVYNRTGLDLTGLHARLFSDDPKIACISDAMLWIGDLPAGTTVTTEEGFRFLVEDVDRTSIEQDFSTTFDIDLVSDQFARLRDPMTVTLDLDLDATGGAGPTVFFEGFEDGFGAFEEMHLDQDLNPPDNDLDNQEAGFINSDGYRCQYNDPDWEESNAPGLQYCYLNQRGQPDAYYFHLTDDRAFSGNQAMHWGIYRDDLHEFTTPLAQLEALRTTAPINLAWGKVCSETRSVQCSDDVDCPVSESCVLTAPLLKFKHQISQVDHRYGIGGSGTGTDRAVVFAQIAGASGEPIGGWIKLPPFLNAYDTRAYRSFVQCSFDPVDDGNDEEDFFDPTDPERRVGPSSTCYPERSFIDQGDTDDPYASDNIGDASDGPGLEGSSGIGTWVQPQFDLSRFRGRPIRIRFLETSISFDALISWVDLFNQIDEVDDGWFIDDVLVTDTLVEPANVTVDNNDNVESKGDHDLDSVGEVCDCAPDAGEAWALPGEALELRLSHAVGPALTTLVWAPPHDLGGTAVAYDTLRSPQSSTFESVATCLESNGADTTSDDTATPAAGQVAFYLIRATHLCGSGPIGTDSSGEARAALDCP
jgi:hypothetical protein